MTRSRPTRLLAAVISILAVTAVAAASAQAVLPSFEALTNGFPVTFTLKGGAVHFENETGKGYGCAASKGEGEIKNHTEATVKVVFTGCGYTNPLGTRSRCQSEGAATEEIRSGTLPLRAVYKSKEKHEVLLDYNYEEAKIPPPPPATFASWTCETPSGEKTTGLGIRRSILASVTPINSQVKTFVIKFTASGAGKQNPKEYENEIGEKFTAFPEMALLTKTQWLAGDLTNEVELSVGAQYKNIEIKA